jgi:hypothetical protein
VTVDENFGVLRCKLAGAGQLRLAGGGREARCNGVKQSVVAMPAFDQFTRLACAFVSRIAKILGAVAVHEHFARHHAHSPSLGHCKEGVDGGGMHGTEHVGGGRAVADQFVEKELGHLLSMRQVGEPALDWKRVVLQPVQQLASAGADDIGLRIMNVRVDETRQQDVFAVIDYRATRR